MTTRARLAGAVLVLCLASACQSGEAVNTRATETTSGDAAASSPSASSSASLAAETSAPEKSPVAVPGTQGYLNVIQGSVGFLLFGSAESSGTYYSAQATGTPPSANVAVSTEPFTDDVQGSSLTLHISGHTDYGTIRADGLTLNVLQSDGSLQAIAYSAATPSDYNAALTQLKAAVASANNAEAQAEASRAQAEASASAAASAQARAEWDAGKPSCDAIHGQLNWGTDGLACEQVPYIGTDGSTYYSRIDISDSGALEGPMGTGGFGATKQECLDAYYPDLSSGAGHGQHGTWNDTLQACLPLH